MVSRKIQSSVSYAEANQVKLIHAQETANVAKQKPTIPSLTWSSASAWASWSAAAPKAMTKVRSKSSSSGVAARPLSCGSRPTIRRTVCCRASGMAESLGTAQTEAPSVVDRLVRDEMPSLR